MAKVYEGYFGKVQIGGQIYDFDHGVADLSPAETPVEITPIRAGSAMNGKYEVTTKLECSDGLMDWLREIELSLLPRTIKATACYRDETRHLEAWTIKGLRRKARKMKNEVDARHRRMRAEGLL